jgi:hypothetical protein
MIWNQGFGHSLDKLLCVKPWLLQIGERHELEQLQVLWPSLDESCRL